jgi:rubrerythrin
MYCPKCGDVLRRHPNGELTCDRGEMALAQALESAFQECFVDRTRIPRDDPFPYGIGGSWWCPGCGVRAEERLRGDLRCPSCGVSFREFIVHLVEIHPHRPLVD